MKIKLGEILDALESVNIETSSYVNVKTGKVYLLGPDEIAEFESDKKIEDFPDWQQDTIRIAREIHLEGSADYIALPDEFEINQYRMMEDFICSLSDDKIARTLSVSIHGSGAFRRFKEHLYNFEMLDDWFKYRENRYRQLAIEWCKDNDLEYEE